MDLDCLAMTKLKKSRTLYTEKSVYLLTNTNMNINEISYEVGFSYPRYFSTSFKQVKGMTPTQFKEESKRN